jgi:hypothetical protein
MSSRGIRRIIALPMLALAALAAPVLAPASQAASGSGRTTAGVPLVSTGSVGRVSGTSATLEGTVDPRTYATSYYFQYGPTVAYGQVTASATLPAGSTATVKVSLTATGFLSGYHYRLVASNEAGPPKDGKDRVYTAPAIKKKNEIVLPKTFQPTPLGGTFVLSGTLTGTGNAGRAVVLQASPYPYTAPYADVGAPMLTGPTGAFAFHVANMLSSTKFRVATVATASSLPLQSAVIPELVTVRVILKARSAGHKGLVRLYGTVTPAEVGAHVFIELEKAPRPTAVKPGKLEKPDKPARAEKEKGEKAPTFAPKFDTIVKRATRTISRFSVVVSVRASGHYRAYVQVESGPVTSGASSTVSLKAPAKKRNGGSKQA